LVQRFGVLTAEGDVYSSLVLSVEFDAQDEFSNLDFVVDEISPLHAFWHILHKSHGWIASVRSWNPFTPPIFESKAYRLKLCPAYEENSKQCR
jgi:hypothetical protein